MATKELASFLASDDVPDTLFGYPVIHRREDYTEQDLQFFKRYPQAAGFYDTDDTESEEEAPPDQAAQRAGVSSDDAYHKIKWAIDDVIPFIKDIEKFRPEAYQDAVGKWTVGYGQTQIQDPITGEWRKVVQGDTTTEKAASAFVEQRVRDNAIRLRRAHPNWEDNLSKESLAGLYDVAYNSGVDILSSDRSPNLNERLQKATKDHDSIVWSEFPTYRKATITNKDGSKTKVVLEGLVNRRKLGALRWGPDGTQGAQKGGQSDVNQWGGNLQIGNRKPYFFTNDEGRVTGYGTTGSVITKHNNQYYVIPSIVEGKSPMSDEDAQKRFMVTGEFWGADADLDKAKALANQVHELEATYNQGKWNEFIQKNWDRMATEITSDPEVAAEHERRTTKKEQK